MSYSEIKNESARTAALALCRGVYQRALVEGTQALSGATLTGMAARYGARYARSGRNLVKRLQDAGLARVEIRAHGKRVLVVGEA